MMDLNQLRTFVESTQSGRATFDQQVTAKSGRKPQNASGTMAFSRPGKFRWTYRHAGKFAVRIAAKAGLPNRVEIRRTFRVSHEPLASDLSKRAVSIYQELCTAIDQREIAN